MSVDLGTAYLTVAPSAKGFAGKLQSQLGGGMASSGSEAGKKFGGGLLAAASKFAAPLAAAVGAGAIVGFLQDSVANASDLNEAGTKTEAIFGRAGKALVDDFAAKGAKALGQSKIQVLDAAATFGTFGKAAGLGGKDLAKFSTGFASLSTDLASFNNTSPEEAVEAIGAALRGEAEPMRKYGVLLDDATLRQSALRLGLIKTTKEALTPQQKVLAAQSEIYRQTGDAQGDFAKTSGGLANQQRILKASFEDIKTQIGAAFLPMLTRLGRWFIDQGLPAVQRFGGWIKGTLWPALQQGYRTIIPGVRQALAILTGGVNGGTISWRKIGEVITTKVIPFLALLARVYLPAVARNIRLCIDVVTTLWRVFTTGRDIIARVVSFILDKFASLSRTWAGVLRALGRVPGFGWAKDAADKLDKAAGKAQTLARNIGNIPNSKTVTIDVNARVMSSRIKVGSEWVNVGLRAAGGPVVKGQPYIVGEKRPELFVPSENGRIEPRVPAESGGGRGGSMSDEVFLQRLASLLQQVPLQATIAAGTVDRAYASVLR
jgi:hypothetical protein